MNSRFINSLKRQRALLTGFAHRYSATLHPIGVVLDSIAVAAAIACIAAMLLLVGFDHQPEDARLLHTIIRGSQIALLVNLLFRIVFVRESRADSRLRLITDILLLLTLIPLIYPHPEHPWIPWLERLLYSHALIYTILAIYSAVTLSYAVMRLPGKRTNPSMLLTLSFLVFIAVGTLVLMLPKCTYGNISFVDALFVSTSAVCITGLTPVDVSTTFTPLGLTALAILIEIGALGVITFTCFFAMFFTGNQSIFSQLIMRDVIYSKSMSAIFPTMLYILGFTVATEAIGAAAIYAALPDTLDYSPAERLAVAAFHSVSAFCNAGFSSLPDGMANPHLMASNQLIYWVMSAIIVAGAIGFPILVNLRDAIVAKFRRQATFHLFDMNTKIVIFTFTALFAAGAIGFFFLERGSALHGMTPWEQVSQSVFNSVVPRSAGFSSVNPAGFLPSTLIMVMFLMWVGGGAQSTAGGIKVNTLAAICLNLRSIVTGRERVTAFHRTLSIGSIRRANAVVAVSILSFFAYAMLMLILEPQLPARAVLFETLSGLFTVGSSLGITASLSAAAKITLSTAMLFGRVGIISLVAGLTGTSRRALVNYPTDNLIIN